MTNGGNYTGSVTRGQVDQWTFAANQGDAIMVTASEVGTNTAFWPFIQVQAPDGKIVAQHTNNLVARVELVATQTGTYTVRVSRYYANDAGGQYVLTLAQAPEAFSVPSGDEGGQMTNGGTYTGNLLRGDVDLWSFAASKGNAITVTASEVGTNTAFWPYLQVYAPSGKGLAQHTNNLEARVDFSAPESGTYTVFVSRYYENDDTGKYSLALAGASGPGAAPTTVPQAAPTSQPSQPQLAPLPTPTSQPAPPSVVSQPTPGGLSRRMSHSRKTYRRPHHRRQSQAPSRSRMPYNLRKCHPRHHRQARPSTTPPRRRRQCERSRSPMARSC